MALTAEGIADLVTTTQKKLGRLKWTDISYDLQQYIAMPMILKRSKVKFEDSGYGIQRNVLIDDTGAARHVGMFATDTVNVGDVMTTMSVPWRHTETKYAYDEKEIYMNRSPAKIVDLVKTRRHQAMMSLAKLLEETIWGTPEDSTDTVTPFGFGYWLQSSATQGFYGTNPVGWADGCGGISSTDYPNWANWTDQYLNVSRTDLIRRMKRAFRKTHFVAPVKHANYDGGEQMGIYMNIDTLEEVEERAEDQNDNLGKDVASTMDGTVFKRHALQWVPYLDADTSDPVLGINWACVHPVFLKGRYMVEKRPRQAPHQNEVWEVYITMTWQLLMHNRRRHWKITK